MPSKKHRLTSALATALFTLTPVTLSGCAANPNLESPPQAAQATPLKTYARWENHCPCCTEAGAMLITNESQRLANPNCGFKSEAFKNVDWAEHDCLLVTAGSQAGRIWWSRIDQVYRAGDTLHVQATLGYVQMPASAQAPQTTEPTSLVLIDKQNMPVSIQIHWRHETPGVGYHL